MQATTGRTERLFGRDIVRHCRKAKADHLRLDWLGTCHMACIQLGGRYLALPYVVFSVVMPF
jgi:hypothetical protein